MNQSSAPTPRNFLSRRAKQVPPELAPQLNVCESGHRTCAHCHKEATRVLPVQGQCRNCHLPVSFCSDECQKQGRQSHENFRSCQEITNSIARVQQASREMQSREGARFAWYQSRFPDVDRHNFRQRLAGRLSEDPYFRPFSDCRNELTFTLARSSSILIAMEASLLPLFLLKKDTFLADPYNVDSRIASIMLKLYRGDDAFVFIQHWLDWRACGPDLADLRDDVLLNWDVKCARDWPLPIIKDARLDDMTDRFRNFPQQRAGISVPMEFALTVLVIKMRFITVYRTRVEAAILYLNAASRFGQELAGVRSHILSFLIEGGRERYVTQMKHANNLMDYIDERDASLLPALVDYPIRRRNQLCFETFLQEYANGEPVVRTIKCILMGRYYKNATTACTTTTSLNKKRAAFNSSGDSGGGSKKRPHAA